MTCPGRICTRLWHDVSHGFCRVSCSVISSAATPIPPSTINVATTNKYKAIAYDCCFIRHASECIYRCVKLPFQLKVAIVKGYILNLFGRHGSLLILQIQKKCNSSKITIHFIIFHSISAV